MQIARLADDAQNLGDGHVPVLIRCPDRDPVLTRDEIANVEPERLGALIEEPVRGKDARPVPAVDRILDHGDSRVRVDRGSARCPGISSLAVSPAALSGPWSAAAD